MAKILIIRTSSFGDVALLVPVVYSVASRYPKDRFCVMTGQAFAPLFDQLGFNISAVPINTKKKHKGILGLFKLVGKALGGRYTHVADTHDVLRSKVIRFFLTLTFTKTAKIDKGRKEKALVISSKDTSPFLSHATERYMKVFEDLGFGAEIIFNNLYDFRPRDFRRLENVIPKKTGTWIGIAPFAQHNGKVYPLQQMEQIIAQLTQRENTKLFLFGSGKKELPIIDKWTSKYPNVVPHHGKLNLDREVLLISYLDIMISMDSANMHLASLVEVPVISIWGATHPSMGFYGYKQDLDNAIQLNMDCRPCSVFGDTPCQFSAQAEYKCLKEIKEEDIIARVNKVLAHKTSNHENSNTSSVLSL